MLKQTRKQKHKESGHFVEAAALAETAAVRQEKEREDKPSAHTDDILADIDEALEGIDAQEFVRSYIQKGGE